MAEIIKPSGLQKQWAELGEKRVPSDTKIQNGWEKEIPTFQDFNWLDGRQDSAIAHINQRGIAEWDASTEYRAGKSYVTGSDGEVYKALTTNTGNNPVGDIVNWVKWPENSLPKITVTLNTDYEFPVSREPLSAVVKNGVLYLNGSVQYGDPLPASSVIFTLPVGYRPSSTSYVLGMKDIFLTAELVPFFLEIDTNGQVYPQVPSSGDENDRIYFSSATPL